jgi:hypothetical protein
MERVPANMLYRLECPVDREPLAFTYVRMAPGKHVHAHLLAETKGFLVVAFA